MAKGERMIEGRSLPSAVALEDVLERGREALDAGHVAGALRTIDDALRIKPAYAPAWRAKGRALRAAGDPSSALVCYAEALRHEPDDEASWFGLAITLRALGRGRDELRAYEALLRRNPRSVPAWMNRGVALHEAGRPAEALACYDRILEMRPEVAAAWNNRGAALLRLGRADDALAAFDEALALDPDLSDAVANRRMALGQLGRDEGAPTPLLLPPPTPLPPALEARVLGNLGLPAMWAWRRNPPQSADDFVAFGTTLLDEGSPEAAASAFRKAEALGAGAVAGVGRLLAIPWAGVASDADRLLESPAPPRAAIAVARGRQAAGDLPGAILALDSLLRRHPGLAWAWNWRGTLELRSNRIEEARSSFQRATQECPSDAETWANLATALHREGRFDEALAACEFALGLDAECAVAANNRGVILATQGQKDEADAALREAARHADDFTIPLNQGFLAESQDRLRAALACFDAVLAGEPRDARTSAARRRLLGRIGAKERESRRRFLSRLGRSPDIGDRAAMRIVRAGFDSPAKVRGVSLVDLRRATGLSESQAVAAKRLFRPRARRSPRQGT